MTEPASGVAAGVAASFAGMKILGWLVGFAAGLSAVVAMCMMTPRDPKEWAVGLISTVMGSITGGAAFIQYFGLADWAQTPIGLAGMLGIAFTCGLPAWALVRMVFTYLNKRKDQDIADVADELKSKWWPGKSQ